MSKIRTIRARLNGGELSPELYGQTDIPRYQHSLEKCRGAILTVKGSARRVPGTRFVAMASGPVVRLIDFPVSLNGSLTGYVLEFGHQTVRFHFNGSQITSGGVPYALATPYPASVLPELRYTASANVLYIYHPQHFPRRLYRKTSDTDWILEQVPFVSMPYMRPPNSENIKLTPSATSGDITITADADWFTAPMVGLKLQINGGTVELTGVTDPRTATATVIDNIVADETTRITVDTITVKYEPPGGETPIAAEAWNCTIEATADYTAHTLSSNPVNPLPLYVSVSKRVRSDILTGTEADKDWKEQAWSALRGYPSCGTFYEQRHVVGGSPTYPTYTWGSTSADPLNFTIGTLDGDGWAFNLAAASTSLFHLIGTDNVTVLSGDSELTMRGGSDSPITPSNIQIKSRTPHGTGLVRPVRVGGEIYFVPPSGLKLRGFSYRFDKDAFESPDVAIIADHLVSENGGIVDLAYAREPYSLLWVLTEDGTRLTLTIDKEQEVTAWAAQDDADARYISTVATQGANGIDQVWFAVQRLVNGVWSTMIEILDPALMTNSTVTASGSGLTSISGLNHLEGRLVDIKADGFYGGRVAVSGGAVPLPFPANAVEVGLPYRTTIKDLPLELANPGQTIQGSSLALNKIRVRLHQSQGCTVNGEQIPFRTFANVTAPVAPFTGDKTIKVMGAGSDPALTQVTIVQDLPFDLSVLAIIKEVSVNG